MGSGMLSGLHMNLGASGEIRLFPSRGGVEGGELSIPPTASGLRGPAAAGRKALQRKAARRLRQLLQPEPERDALWLQRTGGPGVSARAGPPRPAFCLLAIREAREPRRPARQEIAQLLGSRRLRGLRSPAGPTTQICRPDQQHHFQGLQTGSPPASSCHTAPSPSVRGALSVW